MARTTSDKSGRRSLGKRAAQTLRPPEEHLSCYVSKQQDLGYESLNAYLVAVLADVHNLPVPQWAKPRHGAEHDQQLHLGV